jgi:hypothetical protein
VTTSAQAFDNLANNDAVVCQGDCFNTAINLSCSISSQCSAQTELLRGPVSILFVVAVFVVVENARVTKSATRSKALQLGQRHQRQYDRRLGKARTVLHLARKLIPNFHALQRSIVREPTSSNPDFETDSSPATQDVKFVAAFRRHIAAEQQVVVDVADVARAVEGGLDAICHKAALAPSMGPA